MHATKQPYDDLRLVRHMHHGHETCTARVIDPSSTIPRDHVLRISLVVAWSLGIVCALFYGFNYHIYHVD